VIRADGGIFLTNTGGEALYDPSRMINTSTAAYLTVGGIWTNASDVNLKENFQEVDRSDVLSKIAQMSIKKWNYKAEDHNRTHIGPTAQDFYAAFKLGDDDKAISSVDPAGVALVAIQELHSTQQQLKEKATQVDQLQSEVELLRAEVAQMATLLEAVIERAEKSDDVSPELSLNR